MAFFFVETKKERGYGEEKKKGAYNMMEMTTLLPPTRI
jgi:hypothetical protein